MAGIISSSLPNPTEVATLAVGGVILTPVTYVALRALGYSKIPMLLACAVPFTAAIVGIAGCLLLFRINYAVYQALHNR